MGRYSIGQVCLNGHKITGNYDGAPEFRQDYCDRCGEKTINACCACEKPVRGYYQHDNDGGAIVVAVPQFNVPSYCHACGAPFPWTDRGIAAAQELADEIDELNPEEKDALKASIPELTKDSPRSEVASVRFKKLIGKASPVISKAMQHIITSIATEAVKKSLGL